MEAIYSVTLREISGKQDAYSTQALCFRRYPSYKDIKAAYEELTKKELPIELTDNHGKTIPSPCDLVSNTSPNNPTPLFEVRVAKSVLM
jgi:hypothetical protein